MVEGSEMNLLFFFGVLIPALVTVALFLVFCFCWYKMRIRNQVLYKKHDPHKIERLREKGKTYEAPSPPPPPFKSSALLLSNAITHNNNLNKMTNNDNYEEQPEPTEGFDNPTMYRTNPDSGFSDLNQIQCNVEAPVSSPIQRRESDMCRPNSQASDDSGDSGFRSSRSGQYIHSASSSTGNAQENNGPVGPAVGHAVHSSIHVQDAVPLFKPIKIHPNEMGRLPIVSYKKQNSSKQKGQRQRLPIPSSQQCISTHPESQMNTYTPASVMSSPQYPTPLAASSSYSGHNTGNINVTSYPGHSSGQPCSNNNIHYFSKSDNDVHGGRLHSIDSHHRPLPYAGHYGLNPCPTDVCNNRNCGGPALPPQPLYSGGQLSSIGYGSDFNSLGDMNSVGYPCTPTVPSDNVCFSLPITHKMAPMSTPIPHNSYIPGYNISSSSHLRPIHPDPALFNLGSPIQDPRKLTITEAMVHKPYIEELSDPKLYSVV